MVIPAWNEEAYLAAALASVRGQGAPPGTIEVIVVDNGSTDGTVEVARDFARASPEPRVRVVLDGERGRARAKNVGARAARGRVLLFLDADSRMGPGLVDAVLRRVACGERAASIRIVADGTGDGADRVFFAFLEWGKSLFGIRAQMSFCERALFEDVGGFPDLEIGEDREMLVRVARRGIRVGHVDEAHVETSPRRLHSLPLRLGIVTTFGRWALAHAGIGRHWPY